VSLSDVDRLLLDRCISGSPRAWEDFVDRFLGLVIHVANHTCQARGLMLQAAVRDDLVAEVFLAIVANDFAALRRFQRNCSLATYLTVIARRVIVRQLTAAAAVSSLVNGAEVPDRHSQEPADRFANTEEVHELMMRLDPQEAQVVRMYHLEGMSYQQISQEVGMSENSIGPVLSRARGKMREIAGG
jgi:RNA polymerase sigma-70 factor, ECF subfamily